MKVREALERLERLELKQETRAAMAQEPELALRLNREQLLRGLNSKGGQLAPKHSENPYFKSKGAALRYARWKHRLNPLAPFDVPDLFINGFTHKQLRFTAGPDKGYFDAAVPWAFDLQTTFKGEHLGLNPDSIAKYRKVIFPIIRRNINRQFRNH